MEKVKQTIENLRERIELGLRRLCGRITPDKRVAMILAMLVLLGGGSIYMTASSICNYGKAQGRGPEIERIEAVRPAPEPAQDTIHIEKRPDDEPATDQ